MLAKYKIYILLVIFNLTCISSILKSNDIEKIQIVKDNYYIGSLKLVNYKEKTSLLKEKEASYYIINFWASWCAPCIKEMKSLNTLQKKVLRESDCFMLLKIFGCLAEIILRELALVL